MAKDKSLNPAAAQHKADKARALKKSKAAVAQQRAERLAKRNPERLQRQIDELRAAQERGEPLRPRDREVLQNLEKEVRAIRKAREALGERAPSFREAPRGGDGGSGGGVLGKRRRGGGGGGVGVRGGRGGEDGGGGGGGESSETDEDVRDIPMPRDTPPPVPRRERRRGGAVQGQGEGEGEARSGPHPLPAKPGGAAAAPVEAKTVYSAAPVHRDLRKEATSRFVPAAVAQKLSAAKGKTPGKLLEPEELDKLEQQGYGQKKAEITKEGMEDAEQAAEAAVQEAEYRMMNAEAAAGEDVDIDEEAARFERELKHVEMEEVEDEAFTG